jgi:hypothetical protein
MSKWAGRIASLVKCWTHRPKGTRFDPRLDHKRRSTRATKSFSMWDNKDLLIIIFIMSDWDKGSVHNVRSVLFSVRSLPNHFPVALKFLLLFASFGKIFYSKCCKFLLFSCLRSVVGLSCSRLQTGVHLRHLQFSNWNIVRGWVNFVYWHFVLLSRQVGILRECAGSISNIDSKKAGLLCCKILGRPVAQWFSARLRCR